LIPGNFLFPLWFHQWNHSKGYCPISTVKLLWFLLLLFLILFHYDLLR
jgi:hypothetical protein